MITEEIIPDFLGIDLINGTIRLRTARIIYDDNDVEITRQNHSQVLEPGKDISSLPTNVQAICNALWTDAIIADFEAKKAAVIANAESIAPIAVARRKK